MDKELAAPAEIFCQHHVVQLGREEYFPTTSQDAPIMCITEYMPGGDLERYYMAPMPHGILGARHCFLHAKLFQSRVGGKHMEALVKIGELLCTALPSWKIKGEVTSNVRLLSKL